MSSPITLDASTLPPRTVDVGGIRISSQGTSSYELSDLSLGGKPEASIGDVPRPRSDGLMFGKDRLGGRLITLEGSINESNYDNCAKRWGDLCRVWDSEDVRNKSGAVVPMRIRTATGATRRVYGRPRNLGVADNPGFALMDRGRIDFIATFQCVDHYFYSDIEQRAQIGFTSRTTSGLREPLVEPLSGKQSSITSPSDIVVEGDASAWLVATIYGPISVPRILVIGEWFIEVYANIAYDQFVTINATPWDRSVRLNGTVPIAGTLTALSRRLSNARLKPGSHEVVLRGSSAEGTARLDLAWRNTYLAP